MFSHCFNSPTVNGRNFQADEGDARPEGVNQVNASFVEIALADEEDAARGGGGAAR